MKTIKSKCKCGKEVWIGHGIKSFSARLLRRDGKRIYHPENDQGNNCLFRCSGCHEVVSETVPGAEYQTTQFQQISETLKGFRNDLIEEPKRQIKTNKALSRISICLYVISAFLITYFSNWQTAIGIFLFGWASGIETKLKIDKEVNQ